jgi:DNA-binding transcriptional MocR family regulator
MSPTKTFRYEELASHLTSQIQEGRYRPGDRVPSVRVFSQRHGVSMSAVLQAYRVLEDRGMIEARPQSGYYVRSIGRPVVPEVSRPPREAHPVSNAELIMEVIDAISDPDMIPLGAAVPSASLFPVGQVARLIARATAQAGLRAATYLPPEGSPDLREAITRHAIRWSPRPDASDLVVTNGCMEAMALGLLAVARPGDTVAVESPTYFGILQLIATLGMKTLEIPTHTQEGISLSALEEAIRREPVRACVLTPTFHNPLGFVMPDASKQALLALLRKYQLPLIEDDIYGALYFGTERPQPIKAFDRDGWVLYCTSFSKTVSPGLRLGFIAPGPRYMEAVRRAKAATTVATNTPLQLALAAYLRRGTHERHLKKLRHELATNVERMREAVHQYFPPGTTVNRPEGGFVLWVQLPDGIDTLWLYRHALAKKITLTPGTIFSASSQFSHCIRLNCGEPWTEKLEKALHNLGQITMKLGKTAVSR